MSEDAKVEVSEEMEQFISYIENMKVMELSKLVEALEDRLGVTAAAPAAADPSKRSEDVLRRRQCSTAWRCSPTNQHSTRPLSPTGHPA